jgi:hypothetical protein
MMCAIKAGAGLRELASAFRYSGIFYLLPAGASFGRELWQTSILQSRSGIPLTLNLLLFISSI